MSERLKSVNYEIFDKEEHERFLKLKERSGIRSDSEFIRWSLKQLELCLEDMDKDRETLREWLRKVANDKINKSI